MISGSWARAPTGAPSLVGVCLGFSLPLPHPPVLKYILKKKSVQFSGISLFCNHYVCLVPKLLLQKMTPASISNSPSPAQPWTPVSRSVLLWICPFWTFHINGILQHMAFCGRLLSLSTFSRCIHVVACGRFIPFYGGSTLLVQTHMLPTVC